MRKGQLVSAGSGDFLLATSGEFLWFIDNSPANRWNSAQLAIWDPVAADWSPTQNLIPPRKLDGLPNVITAGATSGGTAVHEIAPEADSICHE